jgi:AcrR family transcriptional regulator
MAHAADDTPRRLLEAAGEVFAARGFQAATVREICRCARANLAAVNYHFGDKQQLYIETVKHAQCCGEEDSLPEWPSDTPPAAKLRDYVHRMLARFLDNRRPAWHAQLMAREMADPTEACVALVDSYIRPSYELLDDILEELLPSGTPVSDRHLIAFSIVGQCVHFKIHRPIAVQLVGEEEYGTYDVVRLADHVARFSLAALGHEMPACGGTSPSSATAEP